MAEVTTDRTRGCEEVGGAHTFSVWQGEDAAEGLGLPTSGSNSARPGALTAWPRVSTQPGSVGATVPGTLGSQQV